MRDNSPSKDFSYKSWLPPFYSLYVILGPRGGWKEDLKALGGKDRAEIVPIISRKEEVNILYKNPICSKGLVSTILILSTIESVD